MRTTVSIASRVSLIAADFGVLVVTWSKTFRQTREASHIGATVGLSRVILRDGALFVIC